MSYNSYANYDDDDKLMLEPRLYEYLQKKKYYQQNDIETNDLKNEYAISKDDMVKIRAFLRGEDAQNNYHQEFIDISGAQFPSSSFKKDPRFDRIKEKQKREKGAKDQRQDYGIISQGYDMYRDDRPFASAVGNDFNTKNFHPNEWLASSKNENEWTPYKTDSNEIREKTKGKAFHKSNTYENPKSSYNSYLSNDTRVNNDSFTVDNIIGGIDSYKNKVARNPYEFSQNRMGGQSTEKREFENNYRAVPLMGKGGQIDSDVDTYMRFGTAPSRGGKSLGYPNPMEHYFSYVSNDMQVPEHVVSNRGIPSRAYNTETARPSRELL